MIENQVGFLCNIAFNLSPKNDTYKMLRSYYMMRCHEVTKGYGLPPKYFSSKNRCSHCYSDWTRDSDVKVQPLKLSKKQRQKINCQKKSEQSANEKQSHLLHNEMVQMCSFCGRNTTTCLIKPEKEYLKSKSLKGNLKEKKESNQAQKIYSMKLKSKLNNKITNSKSEKRSEVNLYTNAFDIFSLKNDKNTLLSTIKEPPKVIKNNKKKKDKFAGLCQKAVLATAKLQQQKKQTQHPTQNKLNLFLKPSSG